MKRSTLICLWLFLGVASLSAQDTLFLSLQKAITLAQESSPAARFAKMDYDAARLDFDAFRASLKPELTLSANLPGLSRSISNISQDDGSILFRKQSQAVSTASLNLRQQLGTGGNLFISNSTLGIFNFEPIEATTWRTSLFILGYNQPLFQYNNVKWNKRDAALRLALAEATYVSERELLASNICNLFFQALIFQEQFVRAETNVLNNDTIYRISEGRYDVGKIAENELLQSELSLMQAQANKESADLNLALMLQTLRTTLALPAGQAISLIAPTSLPAINYDPNRAVEEAFKHSRTIRQINFNKFQADQNLAQVKSRNRPDININATFGLNQTANNFPDTYRNPVDRQSFGMGLDIPIFNWGRAKAEREAATLRFHRTYESGELDEQSFRDEVYYQVLTLKQLESQFEIVRRSDEIAQRRYDITKNRYLIGKISIQDLFIAQGENDRARTDFFEILRDFWVAFTALRATTLFDFEKMEPLMREEQL